MQRPLTALPAVVAPTTRRRATAAATANSAAAPTAASLVQNARSVEELLAACGQLQLPAASLPAHLAQPHHAELRQRTATHALHKLARLLSGRSHAAERAAVTADARFQHASLCAALGSSAADTLDDGSRCVEALASLAALGGSAEHAQVLADRAAAQALPLHQASSASHSLRLLRLPPLPALEEATASLPWRVEPHAVSGLIDLELLRSELPLEKATIVTRTGAAVKERRRTCWLAEPGIGGLAYSGKVMPPQPLTPHVTAMRNALESLYGERFDCALCKWYPAGEAAACAWHADPEHGTLWDVEQAIAVAGETRTFCFRTADGGAVHSFPVFDGDVVRMWGACQDEWVHTVLPASPGSDGDRASLVFKRALSRGLSGRKGHGGVTALPPRAPPRAPETAPTQPKPPPPPRKAHHTKPSRAAKKPLAPLWD